MSKDVRKCTTDWAGERVHAKHGPLPTLATMYEYAEKDHMWEIGNLFFKNAVGNGEVLIVFQHRMTQSSHVHRTLYVGTGSVETDDACIPMTHTAAMNLLLTFNYVHGHICPDGTMIHVGCDDCPGTAKHIALQYGSLIGGTNSP